jgi:hypothetical protein
MDDIFYRCEDGNRRTEERALRWVIGLAFVAYAATTGAQIYFKEPHETTCSPCNAGPG